MKNYIPKSGKIYLSNEIYCRINSSVIQLIESGTNKPLCQLSTTLAEDLSLSLSYLAKMLREDAK